MFSSQLLEQSYTIFLDLMLLVGPLLLMLVAYGRISHTLYKGMQMELRSSQGKAASVSRIRSQLLRVFRLACLKAFNLRPLTFSTIQPTDSNRHH